MKPAALVLLGSILFIGCAGSAGNPDDPTAGRDGTIDGAESSGETPFFLQPAVEEGISTEDAIGPGEHAEADGGATPDVIKPIDFEGNKKDLGNCVIGGACIRTIKAKGGSGKYVWSVVDSVKMPNGLELVNEGNSKVATLRVREGAKLDAVGTFLFTVRVADLDDPSRKAERKYQLSVHETIAIDLYTLEDVCLSNDDCTTDDGAVVSTKLAWVRAETKDEVGNALPITIAPGGVLLVEIIGFAKDYAWSIGGKKVECSDAAHCQAATHEGLTLYHDPQMEPPKTEPAGNRSFVLLKAEPEFVGKERKDVVIRVENEQGDKAEKTISSITFEQDPCKVPIVLNGGGNMKKKRGEPYSFAFTVSGGNPPYTWFQTDTNGNHQTPAKVVVGSAFTVAGTAPSDAASIGETIEYNVVVQDSCAYAQQNTAKKKIAIGVGCRIGQVDRVTFNALYDVNPTEDHDVCDDTRVRFELRKSDGTTVASTGEVGVDSNDNGTIDDISPAYTISFNQELCLEDVTNFHWWIDADAGWYYPDVWVGKVLVVAEVGEDEYFAAWEGSIGDSDMGDADSWTPAFNKTCNAGTDVWCLDNPFKGYENWAN